MQSASETVYWSVIPMISLAFFMPFKRRQQKDSIKTKLPEFKRKETQEALLLS